MRHGSIALLAALGLSGTLVACSTKSKDKADPDDSSLADSSTSPTPSGSSSSDTDGSSSTPPPSDGGNTPPVTTAAVHFLGRFDTRDPAGPRASWPGSQIRARFSGTGATLRIREKGANGFNDQLDVSIDGAAPTLVKTKDDVESYPIASGLSDGEHDVVVTKRTETIVGSFQFLGIDSTEGRPLVPTPAPSSRWIEFVGDSITCGYGVLGTTGLCSFDANTESEPLAYGALTAAALNAGHTAISWSGMGIYRDSQGGTTDQMPVRYLRALPQDPESTWDFHIVPDVVVINLGTNDYTKGDPGEPYRKAMTDFTAMLRTKYPKAYIVVSVSSMMTDGGFVGIKGRSAVKTALGAVVEARKSAGDDRISFFEFDEQAGGDGYGCGFHPNQTTQKKGAEKLAAYLRTLTGW